jgi:hypothetical protein
MIYCRLYAYTTTIATHMVTTIVTMMTTGARDAEGVEMIEVKLEGSRRGCVSNTRY